MMKLFDAQSRVTTVGRLHSLRTSITRISALLILALGSAVAQAQTVQSLVGFWWKPSESGWGLAIQQQGTRTFAVWFTYDAQGAPIWHTLECGFVNNTCAGDLFTATGLPLSQITGSSNFVALRSGSGSISVTSGNRLALSYTVGAVTQTKTNLEPHNLVAADQVPVCTLQMPVGPNFRAGLTNYTDHWWGGASAAGWGMQISHQGNQVFTGWYSYNQQGTATWLVSSGVRDALNPRRFGGTIYQVNPGNPFSAFNGPVAQTSISSVGTFNLDFVDGERGAFSFSLPEFGIVNRSLAIERLALAGGAVNICAAPGTSTTATPWTKYFGAHYTNTPNGSGPTRNWAGGGLRYPGGNGSQFRPALSGAVYVDEGIASFTSVALPLINTLLGDGKYAVLGTAPTGTAFLDSMATASGREAYRKSISDRIDQIAALSNGEGWEKKIYFQFGNEISNNNSTGFYGAVCLWATRNAPTPVANCDLVTQFIPTYVEYFLAPGVAHLEEKSQALFGRPDALHAMTGSIVNLSNREAFLDSLLSYRIAGTYAPAYAGRRVYDIVDTVSIHYTVTTPTWRTALDNFRSRYLPGGVPTTRVRALWTTEEGGVRSAEQGYGMASAVRGISRYLSWWQANNVSPDDGHAFYWGSEISNQTGGTSMDQDMPLLHNFVGDSALIQVLQSGSTFAASAGFESYEFAVGGKDKRVLSGFVADGTSSVTLSSVTLNLAAWTGRSVSVSAYRIGNQGPQALVVTPATLVAAASVPVSVSTTLTGADAVLFLVEAPAPAAKVFALMDVGDSTALHDSFAALTTVDGLAVRSAWGVLEPQDGVYDWRTLDAAFDTARARGKQVTLHVGVSSIGLPRWLAALGGVSYTYNAPSGTAVTEPIPWDATFIARYTRFVAALAAHLLARGDTSLLYAVSDGVPVAEMSLVGCRNGALTGGIAYSRPAYLNAWKTTIDAHASAFPDTRLFISAPVGVICSPDNDGKAFYSEVMNHALTRSANVTVFAADLNALGSARLTQLDAAVDARAGIALQTIWSATNDPQNRMRGSLKDAVCRGIDSGARYFEIYKADLLNADASIQDALQSARAGRPC